MAGFVTQFQIREMVGTVISNSDLVMHVHRFIIEQVPTTDQALPVLSITEPALGGSAGIRGLTIRAASGLPVVLKRGVHRGSRSPNQHVIAMRSEGFGQVQRGTTSTTIRGVALEDPVTAVLLPEVPLGSPPTRLLGVASIAPRLKHLEQAVIHVGVHPAAIHVLVVVCPLPHLLIEVLDDVRWFGGGMLAKPVLPLSQLVQDLVLLWGDQAC